MVAVLLGALLMMGVVQVFSGVKRSDASQQAFSRVQESARLAMEMMVNDIRMADYWGCFRQRDAATHVLSVTNRMDTTDADYINWIGANAVSGSDNITSLTIGTKAVLAGTDTIMLKTSMDLCSGQGRVVNAVTAGTLQVNASCPVAAGQAAVVTTCDAGDLFTITSVAGGVLGHNTTYNTGRAIKNSSAALSKNYGAEAKILAPQQRAYFVATGTGGSPSLFRSDNNGAAEELVPGVENLQILYGEDANADSAPDKYSTAAAVTNMDNVRSVKITLTVRSDVRMRETGDGLLRKDLSAVADIRNRSLN
jgi:type IV pilus assembly protein PilW